MENASNYKKISGDEAGCAPKKGVITSKNMGKAYAKMWSMDVKVEGKGVVRFGDIMTSNHASDTGDTPPMPTVATANMSAEDCAAVLTELKIILHAHGDNPCGDKSHDGQQLQSEHMCMNAFFQNNRAADTSIANFPKYSSKGAPCICMQGPGHAQTGSTHGKKTLAQYAFVKKCKDAGKYPTAGEVIDQEIKTIGEEHENLKGADPKKKEDALNCLKAVCEDYLEKSSGKSKEDMRKSQCRMPFPDADFPTPPSAPKIASAVPC